MASILAYLSYTLQLSTTFPYFTHLPLHNTTNSGNWASCGPALPLHKSDKTRRPAGYRLFSSDFAFCPTTTPIPSSRCKPSNHVPARPSPLRKSFTQSDHRRPDLGLASRNPAWKTAYFSPLTSCFEQEQELAPSHDATAVEDESLDITSPFAADEDTSHDTASCRPRSRYRPKKAKSMDNFRTTLFPLWETDETQSESSIWGLSTQQQRFQGKRRTCSAV
jgi:hypothetical protein